MKRRRLLPHRSFPNYAYLPGRQPHPVRHPEGHSYGVEPIAVTPPATLDSEEFAWGQDLFNHGYYWEAHEAWEGLWQVADKGSPLRTLLKALILLSAAGVKIREGKRAPAMRHAGRAAGLLRQLAKIPHQDLSPSLGMPLTTLADFAEATASSPPVLQVNIAGEPEPVFEFFLGSAEARTPISGQPFSG